MSYANAGDIGNIVVHGWYSCALLAPSIFLARLLC
jgi:hypothetical protein